MGCGRKGNGCIPWTDVLEASRIRWAYGTRKRKTATMLSQLFILSPRGDTIVFKDCILILSNRALASSNSSMSRLALCDNGVRESPFPIINIIYSFSALGGSGGGNF